MVERYDTTSDMYNTPVYGTLFYTTTPLDGRYRSHRTTYAVIIY